MRKTRKTKKKQKRKIILLVIGLVVITIGLLALEIRQIVKDVGNENNIDDTSQVTQNVVDDKDLSKEVVEGIKFDSFVDKSYTKSELESMTDDELKSLYDFQIELTNEKEQEYYDVFGSAETESEAEKIVYDNFDNENQFVNKVELDSETEKYYVLTVNWDYINQNVAKNYTKKVIVFKEFYYNFETNTFNLDNIQNVKEILDIENYIKNYSNSGKRIIQSFIDKSGQNYQYSLYYLDIVYGRENEDDIITPQKEIVTINATTGVVESISKERW